MGGLRVLLIDALFLRAQALQSQSQEDGNLEEAASLYRTILELDPENDAAAAYLVDVYVFGLLPIATTPEGRFAWWNEGWDLAHRALELRPDSPLLHLKVAQILLDLPYQHPDLVQRVDALVPNREATAMVHLLRSAELTDNLPTAGYRHLMRLAVVAPSVALDAARAGEDGLHAQAMAAGRRLLELRGDILATIEWAVVRDGAIVDRIPLRTVLTAALATVPTMRDAAAAGDRAAMQAAVRRYAETAGEDLFLERLRAWAWE